MSHTHTMIIAPCPFCGGDAVNIKPWGREFFVQCPTCNAEGPLQKGEDEAIEWWNKASANRLAEVALENIAARDCGVMVWRNGARGWLAALTDDRENAMVPNSTNWDYSKTPAEAIQRLIETARRLNPHHNER